MTVGYRAMGPRNASLPQATADVIGFLHDPDRWPYMQYVQLIGLPEESNGIYRYPVINPDDSMRLVTYGEFAWGWDDKRPRGEGFKPRVEWLSSETKRYAFGYTIGDRTQRAWTNATKINPKALYDVIRRNHAGLHRASRAVDFFRNFSFPAYNTSDLQALLGNPAGGAYWDQSSGNETTVAGNPNPLFQVIKKTQNIVMRRIDLQTNGAVTGEEFVQVMGPKVAQQMAIAGEMVNYLKQSPFAETLMKRNKKWGLPDEYNGWKLVVEDTPRVFVRQSSDDTVLASPANATTTLPPGSTVVYNERDYVWNDDTVLFTSRVGGLDGNYGFQNFSTCQMFYYNGLAEVTANTEAFDQLTEGSISIEDDFQMPAPISGFKLTGVLSALPT
jgi:hypothetical protein